MNAGTCGKRAFICGRISNPLFDIAVAAVASPTGAKLAGRHGAGMLSVGATTAARLRCACIALGCADGGGEGAWQDC